MQETKLIGYGVDTLMLNVRYADSTGQPVKQDLDERLAQELDYLQGEARAAEAAVASPWALLGVLLFVEPHGAGKQWRWLLTSRLLNVCISRGKFNDIIAQVRFSSEFLWSQSWCGDALYKVHAFLMALFGEHIHLQVSEVHLCADVVGYDFSQCNYEEHFVTRVRKNEAMYGVDGVALDCHRVLTLAFSKHTCPLSCSIYNKTLEITQKSHKTWFYDLWQRKGWDGVSAVWRVEFRFKREFLHEVKIEWAYDLLDEFKRLWEYAAGRVGGGDDGLPDGWLRYVVSGEDSNRSRWPVHPAWVVVQGAFADDPESDLGLLVRERVQEMNIDRGLAATLGYMSSLAAWKGGELAAQEADFSLVLHWLNEVAPDYLEGDEVIEKPITTRFKLPKVEKKFIPTFTFEDVEKLFQACERRDKRNPFLSRALTARDRAIVAVLLDAGIRRKELVALRLCDVDTELYLLNVHRKGNKWQQVPISREGFKALYEYVTRYRKYLAKLGGATVVKKQDELFLSDTGEPLTIRGSQRCFRYWKDGRA